MHPTHIFKQSRNLITAVTSTLTDDQLFMIPTGFDNNIAWNLGHIVAVQQSLTYRLAGLPTLTTREQNRMFRPGTSPADWAERPDPAELRRLLAESTEQLLADYPDKFTSFQPYTTTTGFSLASIHEAVAFNDFHEGLHLGAILALRNLVV